MFYGVIFILTNSPLCLTSGLMMGVAKPPPTHSSTTDPAMAGICKELIGQSMARLRSCSATEESMADRLISDLKLVYMAVQTISDLYDSMDDDSQDSGESQLKKYVGGKCVANVKRVQKTMFFI